MVKGSSERRACFRASLPRATHRYQSRRAGDTALLECLKETSQKHPRFGYRRLHAMAKRQGYAVNHKRVYRICKDQGLSVRRQGKRRSSLPPQERPNKAERPNHVWTVDFVHDQLMSVRRIKLLIVTDEYTRQSLAITVGYSLKAKDVEVTLARLFEAHGTPKFLRSDNGSEFIAITIRGFLRCREVAAAYIDKGSPWQNGFAESFHGRFRDEFLNGELFLSLADATVRTEIWRRWYNQERPHSSLGYASPNEFAENAEKEKVTRLASAETNTNAGT